MRAPSELEGSLSSFARQRQHVRPAPDQLVARPPEKRIRQNEDKADWVFWKMEKDEEEEGALKDERVSVMLQMA